MADTYATDDREYYHNLFFRTSTLTLIKADNMRSIRCFVGYIIYLLIGAYIFLIIEQPVEVRHIVKLIMS